MEVTGLLQGGLVEAVQLVLCRTSDVETRGFPPAVGCGPRSISRSKYDIMFLPCSHHMSSQHSAFSWLLHGGLRQGDLQGVQCGQPGPYMSGYQVLTACPLP